MIKPPPRFDLPAPGSAEASLDDIDAWLRDVPLEMDPL